MKPSVGVVDYGMGNLHSVAKALSLQNVHVTLTNQKNKLRDCEILVMPGVGAFGEAMKTLAQKKLDDFVVNWIGDGKPYLGICLGYQLLFERSEESPQNKGFSVFKGSVLRFSKKDVTKISGQIPHMGWNTARQIASAAAPFFKGIKNSDYFYFVHSYFPEPQDGRLVATQTSYGRPFASSIATDSLFASQFHPEKSGRVGLSLLNNFVSQMRTRS